ncbi:hypothetical protein [Pseudoalteromonas sp. PA2MD11]|uniref:hypothetical protein n=1 Tax=Pseudoalteromonas sp. PA2MD11 TaxID=2785057 RepID=UPI001ADFCF03|nr:hypothetical protein [Pseudoalteromonas sp. PA2MD11]
MSTWQGNTALAFASIALGLSIYSYTTSNSTDKPVDIQQSKPNLKELTIPELEREPSCLTWLYLRARNTHSRA